MSPDYVPYSNRVKVSFAGDSITVGNFATAYGGYRFDLINYLTSYYGYIPNIVGKDYYNSYSYACMGASGITSGTLHSSYTGSEASTYTPSIVFMLIGSNDAASSVPTNTYVANVNLCLDDFRTAVPTCHVFISGSIDRTGFTSTITTYNASLLTSIQARNDYANGYVHYVDQYTALGVSTGPNFADGIHPSQQVGYSVMATTWYNSFRTVFI